MQRYNPAVPNPSCQGTCAENPCYDREQVKIRNKYEFFKAMRLISIDARLKQGQKLEDLGLYPDQMLEWNEHIRVTQPSSNFLEAIK